MKLIISLFIVMFSFDKPNIYQQDGYQYHLCGKYQGLAISKNDIKKFDLLQFLKSHPEYINEKTKKAAAIQLVMNPTSIAHRSFNNAYWSYRNTKVQPPRNIIPK